MLKLLLAAVIATAPTPPAAAQTTQTVSASDLQLVVFNRPGPKWAERASVTPLLLAHRDLYLEMAKRGEIILSGRFTGEPLLGLSLFASSANETDVRKRLEADPAVTGGYIALEFRTFVRNFGGESAQVRGKR